MTPLRCALLLAGGLFAGCSEQNDVEPALSAELAHGKEIWDQNCQVCHGPGLAGAPPKGDDQAWAARIAKGLETLVQNATLGYSGPGGHQMPARGGNSELSDDEVEAAVSYMVSQSQ